MNPTAALFCRRSLLVSQRSGFVSFRKTTGLRTLTTQTNNEPVVIYDGPLAKVARRLKLFSITSLGLGCGISPFVFAIDVPVPFVAKAALVGAAVVTSAASTGLIQWVMSPYVTKITTDAEHVNDPTKVTIHTLSFLAKDHATQVPVEALGPSSRIFTSLMVTDAAAAAGKIGGDKTKPKMLFYVHPELCQEGTMKTLTDKTGLGQGF